MTDIDYAERVRRGIALLDQKWPAWATEIDLDTLDIKDGLVCMTAQYAAQHSTAKDWYSGMEMLGLSVDIYEGYGFKAEVADEDTAYPVLNALWRSAIEARRSAAQPEASER